MIVTYASDTDIPLDRYNSPHCYLRSRRCLVSWYLAMYSRASCQWYREGMVFERNSKIVLSGGLIHLF